MYTNCLGFCIAANSRYRQTGSGSRQQTCCDRGRKRLDSPGWKLLQYCLNFSVLVYRSCPSFHERDVRFPYPSLFSSTNNIVSYLIFVKIKLIPPAYRRPRFVAWHARHAPVNATLITITPFVFKRLLRFLFLLPMLTNVKNNAYLINIYRKGVQ